MLARKCPTNSATTNRYWETTKFVLAEIMAIALDKASSRSSPVVIPMEPSTPAARCHKGKAITATPLRSHSCIPSMPLRKERGKRPTATRQHFCQTKTWPNTTCTLGLGKAQRILYSTRSKHVLFSTFRSVSCCSEMWVGCRSSSLQFWQYGNNVCAKKHSPVFDTMVYTIGKRKLHWAARRCCA